MSGAGDAIGDPTKRALLFAVRVTHVGPPLGRAPRDEPLPDGRHVRQRLPRRGLGGVPLARPGRHRARGRRRRCRAARAPSRSAVLARARRGARALEPHAAADAFWTAKAKSARGLPPHGGPCPPRARARAAARAGPPPRRRGRAFANAGRRASTRARGAGARPTARRARRRRPPRCSRRTASRSRATTCTPRAAAPTTTGSPGGPRPRASS